MDITEDVIAAYDKAYPVMQGSGARKSFFWTPMAGYLDQYGKGEKRREKIFKIAVSSLIALVVIGGPLMFIFHNYRQERQVSKFFDLLAAKDYRAAYALWGCTESKPCSGYSMQSFMEDWGPNRADPSNFRIAKSRSCGSRSHPHRGFRQEPGRKLWVQRDDLVIGFSPLPGCPAPQVEQARD